MEAAPSLRIPVCRHSARDRSLAALAPAAVTALAVWPVWLYLWRAYASPGTDPAGVVVLLGTVIGAVWFWRSAAAEPGPGSANLPGWGIPARSPGFTLWTLAAGLGLYAAAYSGLPALARAAVGLGLLGAALVSLPGAGWRRRSGVLFLLMLGAPWGDSLSFFLGGPLRAASAQVAAVLLGIAGAPARVEAASLWIGEQMVSVDAPCSGVNGLWSALVVAAALAAGRGLSLARTIGLIAAAAALCVPANGWRAAALVFWEALAPRTGPGAAAVGHESIGLFTFVAVATILWLLARDGRSPDTSSAAPSPVRSRGGFLPLLAAAGAAALFPLLPASAGQGSTPYGEPAWPESWCGQPLRRLPETEMDRRWAAAAPGPLARFALPDGGELLLRWVDRPSRAVHPAEDCYRGSGYAVSPLKPVRAPVPAGGEPVTWRRFRAERRGESLTVRGVILSQTGESYPDPAWWWWKTAGPGARDRGPWWVATIQ